jgi:SAM-dependent methyltransferase
MGTFVSIRTFQFSYFDPQLGHPDWSGKTVLDFGGNAGNILRDPNCTIDPAKYWCVDLSRDAIELGRKRHPTAHFEFYDRYNFEYNPGGVKELPVPDLGRRFDIIIAYSVFTHTSRGEMRDLVKQLRALLTDGGVLAFTFVDPDWQPPPGWVDATRGDETPDADNLMWRLIVSRGREEAVEWAADARRNGLTWVTLVNHEELVLDEGDDWVRQGEERSQYFAFCTTEHMSSLYPEAEIRPPVRPQRHSCCILRN